MTPKFKSFHKDGEISIPIALNQYVKSLNNPIQIVVKKWSDTRSNQQNRYLWGVVYKIISDETGESSEKIHEIMTVKYLKKTRSIQTKKGEQQVEYVESSTKLNTVEFNEYFENIRGWAFNFLDIVIPLPNEVEL